MSFSLESILSTTARRWNTQPTSGIQSRPQLEAEAETERRQDSSSTPAETLYGTSSPLHHFISNQATPNPSHNRNQPHPVTLPQPRRPLPPLLFSEFDDDDDIDNLSSSDLSEYTVDSSLTHDEVEDEIAAQDMSFPPNTPAEQLNYRTTSLASHIGPRSQPQPRPAEIDLTQTSPSMATSSNTRKRSFASSTLDPTSTVTPSSSAKRRRTSATTNGPAVLAPTREIEHIDLVASDPNFTSSFQQQRADAVKATQPPQLHPSKISKLSTLQCTVCLDAPDDLTATSCGHTFCRACLMNWLMAGEKEPTRRPNCPACRKTLKRSGKNDTIPLEIMKRPRQ